MTRSKVSMIFKYENAKSKRSKAAKKKKLGQNKKDYKTRNVSNIQNQLGYDQTLPSSNHNAVSVSEMASMNTGWGNSKKSSFISKQETKAHKFVKKKRSQDYHNNLSNIIIQPKLSQCKNWLLLKTKVDKLYKEIDNLQLTNSVLEDKN